MLVPRSTLVGSEIAMFKIGEFSRISRTPISRLRYYDEVKLFSPAYTDEENGYRYYRIEQLADLYRILALKDLGLGLEQIRKMTAREVTPEEIRGMLNLKKAQLEQSIQEDIQRLQSVESRRRGLEAGQPAQAVVVKSLPAVPILSVRKVLAESCHGFSLMESIRTLLPEKVAGATYLTAVMHDESFDEVNVDVEIGYIMEKYGGREIDLPGGETARFRMLPAVDKAAVMVRRGNPENGYDLYASLARWIDENGYDIAGPSREIFLTPPRPGREGEMTAEIQWPVKSRAGDIPREIGS